ncbi:MAG: hypothetical protein NT062_11495 [Proteobacteria bacterium]|nr:hypothetical protein [Pseudomonadota bacterium]
MPRALLTLAAVPPPIVGSRTRELRRAGIAAANLCIRRRTTFHGWLQMTLLRKQTLTRCGCGLINCR